MKRINIQMWPFFHAKGKLSVTYTKAQNLLEHPKRLEVNTEALNKQTRAYEVRNERLGDQCLPILLILTLTTSSPFASVATSNTSIFAPSFNLLTFCWLSIYK